MDSSRYEPLVKMTEKVKVLRLIYTAQFLTLSGDQNEVFKYLVLHSLLLTAYFTKSNGQKIFFSFSTFDFYGLFIVYTKSFSLWRKQKYRHRGTSNVFSPF